MTTAVVLLPALVGLWLLVTSRRGTPSDLRAAAVGGALGFAALASGLLVGALLGPAQWGIPVVAAWLALVAALAVLAAILASRSTEATRPAELHALVLLAGAAAAAAILSSELTTFVAFAQWSVVAQSLLAGGWGTDPRGRQGTRLFTTLTAANLLLLLAETLRTSRPDAPAWTSVAFLLALGAYFGVAPFHGPVSDVPAETPAVVGIGVSALSLAMGVMGVVRFALPHLPSPGFPDGVVVGLVLVTMGIAACAALLEPTSRRALALSGLWTRGVVLLALLSWTPAGIGGALLLTCVHVLFLAGVLPLADHVDRATGSRLLERQQGALGSQRSLAWAFGFLVLAQSGLPPFGGFQAELAAFHGILARSPLVAGVAALTVLAGSLALVRLWLALVQRPARDRGAPAAVGQPARGLLVGTAILLLLAPVFDAAGRLLVRAAREVVGGGP